MKKKLFITSLFLLFGLSSFAFNNAPPGIDESKMQSSQIAEGMSVNKPEFDTDEYAKKYKKVTKDGAVMQAMELMEKLNIAKYSYNALMGNNLTEKPFKIEFKNIAEIRQEYASFDALGWKKKNRLYIYINEKHRNAPAEALAALLPLIRMATDTIGILTAVKKILSIVIWRTPLFAEAITRHPNHTANLAGIFSIQKICWCFPNLI